MKITDVKTILTAPNGIRLVVVKIETSEPGLYGIGCATFTQRPLAVATAVDEYLKPFLIGKDPANIEDIFQTSFVSSYWRNGPVLNNALSGVDIALWDIMGKRANMPVYQLLGGKCREAATLYAHAGGGTFEEVEQSIRRYMEQGYRYVRAQVAIPGYSTYGAGGGKRSSPAFEPTPYVNTIIKLFDHLRTQLGDEVELLHDVHERIPPIQAINLAKGLEPYNLFFLEDPFAPEDVDYFQLMRQQTSIPIAMGELFNNPNEYVHLIKDRLLTLSGYIFHKSVVSVRRVNSLRSVNSSVSARRGTAREMSHLLDTPLTLPWIWRAITSVSKSSTSSETIPKRCSLAAQKFGTAVFGQAKHQDSVLMSTKNSPPDSRSLNTHSTAVGHQCVGWTVQSSDLNLKKPEFDKSIL